jgi:hypothetical protein
MWRDALLPNRVNCSRINAGLTFELPCFSPMFAHLLLWDNTIASELISIISESGQKQRTFTNRKSMSLSR